MRVLLTLTIALLSFAPVAQEQQDRPLPDRWRGLILDQSTPEDAVAKFGKPEKDEMSVLRTFSIDEWLTEKRKQKIFRQLQFKNVEGMDKVFLSFLDGKLVAIDLDIKKEFAAQSLGNSYGVEFRPVFSGLTKALHPEKFERMQGRDYPRTYPTVYRLVAVTPKSFLNATVGNASFGAAFRDLGGVTESEGTFPGKVVWMQLVSRTLENRDGADVLK
jgi:hypothetical protein